MSNKFLDAVDKPAPHASLVRPSGDSMALGVVVSVFLHLCAGVGAVIIQYTHDFLREKLAFLAFLLAWLPECGSPPAPPPPAMEVSMMVLPHADRMPDKAMHKPRSGAPAPNPEVATAPVTSTAPPDASTSDLTFEDPTKKPTATVKKPDSREDLARKREEAMRRMMMEDAVADVESPEGPRDREQTDPNSNQTERIDLGGLGLLADPEVVKHLEAVKRLFVQNFHPLKAITDANPGLRCKVMVRIDVDSGQVLSYDVQSSSGNPSFDTAAINAAAAVASVPVPPSQFKEKAKEGYIIEFKPTS